MDLLPFATALRIAAAQVGVPFGPSHGRVDHEIPTLDRLAPIAFSEERSGPAC